MTHDLTRTLLVDAVIVAVLVALALILAPGYAIVGLFALIILLLGGISFLFGGLRARRRRKRQAAHRRELLGSSTYGPRRAARGERQIYSDPLESEGPQVRRVPASRRTQTPRKPLP